MMLKQKIMTLLSWVKNNPYDVLLYIQLICGTIFCVSQGWHMYEKTTQGVNVSWFVSWEVFLGLNIWLANDAYRAQPSEGTKRTFKIYLWWMVMITINTVLMFYLGGVATWDQYDTLTMKLVAIGAVMAIGYGLSQSLGLLGSIKDPIIRGVLALVFKAVPQFILAYKMYQIDGSGLALLTVVNGHITVLTRIGQLVLTIRESGWDRNCVGSAISEVGNELSWAIVTLVWILR